MPHETILRQLNDIQEYAKYMFKDGIDSQKLETFCNYSDEINSYILNNGYNTSINDIINNIKEFKLRNILRSSKANEFYDFDLIGLFKSTKGTNDAYSLINIIKDKYATIEFLIKSSY